MSNLPDRLGDSDTSALLKHGRAYGVAAAIAVGAIAYMSGGISGVEMGGAVASAPTADADLTGVVFHSDWSSALGTGIYAMNDSAKVQPWGEWKNLGAGTFEIVSATGSGFPTTNMAQSTNSATNSPANGVRFNGTTCVAAGNCLPIPAAGSSIYFRTYFKNTTDSTYIATGGDALNHPLQDGTIGGSATNWQFEVTTTTDNKWWLSFFMNDGAEQAQIDRYTLGAPSGSPPQGIKLDMDVVYMIELQIDRFVADSMQAHARVSDGDGNLLYSDADFYQKNGSGSTMADSLKWAINDTLHFRGLNIGSNGWSVDPASDYLAFTWAGVCIRTTTWCGAYNGSR